MQMRKRWARKESGGMFAWEKFLSDLNMVALFSFVQRGKEVSLHSFSFSFQLVIVSLHGAATSFSLMWYARAPHCIVLYGRYWTQREENNTTDEGCALDAVDKRSVCCQLCVCVDVLFSNAKASSVPPSRVSAVIRSVICTGCDMDAAAFWTASGQREELVCVCPCVCVCAMTRTRLPSKSHDAN